ncbi:hypothetical protein [Gordonia sp. NB41Y]|uniref:hypothetical protein n=1 Tax=Gordonia sp. NB41Y TaxID=875808 RepID=UPI0002BE56CC|nr:hypothetical protein [Gordonia sp. NB41Y]WLP90244.1 hypothetical protein Q9K23_22465 [Gordonia sp. NB41Y]
MDDTTGPAPIEPCAIWHRAVNDWPETAIADALHISAGAVMKAIHQQNQALTNIDPTMIADPMIGG